MKNTDTSALLNAILAKLDRGDCPDRHWPDRHGDYRPLCPFHHDTHSGSFYVGPRGYKCFACDAGGSLVDLARHLGIADADTGASASNGAGTGLTLEQYARDKQISRATLASWGVREERNGRGTYVAIPYRDQSGKEVAVRRRFSLTGPRRFGWRPGDTPMLYGLWRLEEFRRSHDWVLLVEGESDCHTAWTYGLPVLGVPGASSWRPQWAEYLRGLRVYVWREPDDGGATFVRSIAASIPDALVLVPPEGIKDPSAAHLQHYDLRELVDRLKSEAVPASEGEIETPARFYPRPYTELLLKRYRFLASGTTSRDDLYVYDELTGLWRDNAQDFVASRMRREAALADEQKKRYAIEEIVADVRGLAYNPAGLPQPDPHLLPFSNGVYDLREGALRPFTPEDGFTWKLPHPYAPKSRSEFLRQHLAAFSQEIQIHFLELLAYSLWRGYPYQKFFFWYGRGSNGKSFLANVLRYALGVQHVSALTLSDLQTNRFAAAALYGKLANVAGEVAYADLENTDLLKKLTGDDWLQCERKYRDPIPFRSYAKLVFLTNALPVTRDTTDAFYRRAFLVQFDQQFAENPAVLNQLSLLAASASKHGEFAWLLSHAVVMLHDLIEHNFVFTGNLTLEENRDLYERLSNPVRQFLDEQCLCTYQADDYIYKTDFQERLTLWLRARGLTSVSAQRLGKMMKAMGIEDGRRGENSQTAWIGWRWR